MTLDRDTLDRLYRYCYCLTGKEDTAYDLLQQSLESYLKARKSRDVGAAVPYLRKIIRNQFIDALRRSKRFPELDLDEAREAVLDIGTASLEDQVIAAGDIARIWKRLNPVEREALYMWAVEGYTAAEIAEATSTSRNTILSRIHRIRKKVRAWYGVGGKGGEEVGS